MNKVITFGEILLRLSPNGYYRFFQNDQMQVSFGGAEANVAVSLANLGLESAFVTKLPENPIGNAAVVELKKFGVNTNFINRGGERCGIYFQEKGAGERGSVCIYDRKYSAIQEAKPEDFDWDVIFENAEWFHFTGITPAIGGNLPEICLQACQKAKEKGLKISCDLNYRSKLWTKAEAQKTMSKLCSFVDLCIANEEDAKDVFGIAASNTDINAGKLDKKGYCSVARQLKDRFGFERVAITLRTSFSASDNDWAGLLYDGKDFFFSPTHHLRIVDRVGGGDSFAAGMIYALINNYSNQEAIDFAVAASALKHTIEGDFNRITLKEIQDLMCGNSSGRIKR